MDSLFSQSCKLKACKLIKKNTDNNAIWLKLQNFSEQLFYRGPVEAAIGGVP